MNIITYFSIAVYAFCPFHQKFILYNLNDVYRGYVLYLLPKNIFVIWQFQNFTTLFLVSIKIGYLPQSPSTPRLLAFIPTFICNTCIDNTKPFLYNQIVSHSNSCNNIGETLTSNNFKNTVFDIVPYSYIMNLGESQDFSSCEQCFQNYHVKI